MRYCSQCVLPDTRPNLVFDAQGVCSACRQFLERPVVDWAKREIEFRQLVEITKHKAGNSWDCVIPVSGGKDSTWQVVVALKYGLKPLCVTWKTPARNELGQRNLDNIISLGVDHLDLTINPQTEKKFTLKAFKKYGATAIPMHMAVFSLPLQVAIRYKIPLVLWGENSAVEYGSTHNSNEGWEMNREWLRHYGVTNGTVAEDWVDENLTLKDMAPYIWPTDKELKVADVRAAFLGHFFQWDPLKTYEIAKQYGFKAGEKALTGLYEFADVDDSFLITLHHWLKWYKFGFTRTSDNLSLEIRNKRMTRSEAIRFLKERGDETPSQAIEKFCQWVGLSQNDYSKIVESFRNQSIWKKESEKWKIPGFLIEDWSWR